VKADRLKKSILQTAVQGRLIAQNPADEPAKILLEKIRKERKRLIKEGNIKKDRQESVIYRADKDEGATGFFEKTADGKIRDITDELPFEIPKSWEIVRLNEIGIYRKGPFGSSLTKSMFVPKSKNAIKVYEQKNAIQRDALLGEYYIAREYFEAKMRGFEVYPGDIIVSCAGTIGETYVLPVGIEQGIINQALMRMKITSIINADYFLLYFDYVLKRSAQERSKGSAIKNIPPFEIFKRLILPLPPLAEQARIVKKIEELESLRRKLQEALQSAMSS
jgi:type I restriction enzyme S subunit